MIIESMSKEGFYIDMTLCLGCRACQTACKDKNNLPEGVLFRKVRTCETGTFPEPGTYHYSSACNHCETPMCTRACPTGAMHIAKDLTVQHDAEMCIKCRYCVNACPYGVPQYVEAFKRIAQCDACIDLRESGQNPVCVDACVMNLIEWGPLEALRSKHRQAMPVNVIALLPDASKTKPSLLIKPKQKALLPEFTRMEPLNG